MLSTTTKNTVLLRLKSLLKENSSKLLEINKEEVAVYTNWSDALKERLVLNEKKIDGLITAIDLVIGYDDPIWNIISSYVHANGMKIENRRTPLWKILIIYESRPDVTIEASISCFKAWNKVVLKWGKEATRTNLFLVGLWHQALTLWGVDNSRVSYLDVYRREIQMIISQNTLHCDLLVPRGWAWLISFVKQYATIPYIISWRGNNFLYIDERADLQMAQDIIIDWKKKIWVCNALDKVLIHQSREKKKDEIEMLMRWLLQEGIDVYGLGACCECTDLCRQTEDASLLDQEFLSKKILFSSISSYQKAVETINTHSWWHSASIVSSDKDAARYFQDHVECAAVYHNTSTRFTDGWQFWLWSELAVSTQKLHTRWPMGVAQLTSNKRYISGTWQVRG